MDRRLFRVGCIGLLALGLTPAFAADPPTFQQVLADPDNVAQNFAYAKSEAEAGHLLAAAAALERILLVAPNENGVRLTYIAVLYRLDDLQGAQQQLDALDESALTPLQKREAEKYRGLIADGRSGFKMSGDIALGLAHDSNAAGALNTDLEYFFPTPRQSGDTVVVSGELNLSQDISADGDLKAFAMLDAYSRSTMDGPDADYVNANAFLGVEDEGLMSDLKLGAVLHRYQIFDEPFLTEYGGRAEYSWRYDTALTLFSAFEGVGQSYHEPLIASLVPFLLSGTQNGARYDLSGGASYRPDSTSTFTASVGYEDKTAGYEPFAYGAPFIDASYHGLLGSGAYLDFGGEYRFVDYRQADFVFLGDRRADNRETARIALGAPLSAFAEEGATGDYRENLIVEGALTYIDRESRYPVASFTDIGMEIRIVWKFGRKETGL